MYKDYQNPEQYFTGTARSKSIVMVGKTKRKLFPIEILIWETVHKEEKAEIDKEVTFITKSYIGVEFKGAINDKQIYEGFTDFEALISLLNSVQFLFGEYQEEKKQNFYIKNYAGESWHKVTLNELFLGLVRENDEYNIPKKTIWSFFSKFIP